MPSFKEIYSQAIAAEAYGLREICGAGYRRSLEFLVKEYLLSITDDDARKASIKAGQLGPCIQNFVTNENLKEVARRAAWLGNDETHFERKWEGKDLSDLKMAIRLTIAWIETELLTKQLKAELPDKRT